MTEQELHGHPMPGAAARGGDGAGASAGSNSGDERRREILRLLEGTRGAIPGDDLAERLGVSRQAIVHDIALLRTAGAPILATIRGYVLASASGRREHRLVVAVRHGVEAASDELYALVDAGVRVVDVFVEHPMYGELRKELRLATRTDVRAWAEATDRSKAHLLSELTDGVHSHTLEADDPGQLDRAIESLRGLGFLLEDRP